MLLSVQEKEKQQCIQLQNTSYILLLSVCFKKENVHMISWRYHINPKGSLIYPKNTLCAVFLDCI